MNAYMLLWIILVPAILSIPIFLFGKKVRYLSEVCTTLAVTFNVVAAFMLFGGNCSIQNPWISVGNLAVDFSLKLFHFNSFIVAALAVFAFLITLYALAFFKGKEYTSLFYAFFLITVSMANGAVLANNLVLMLFFWEGLLITLFALIMTGGKSSFGTAIKAFIIVGVADLCLMVGVAMTGYIAKTFQMDQIHLQMGPLTSFAFILMLIGAISKAGSMPFHSWIPDAATDAPLPFMAFLPGALEKLVGIYFVARFSLDLFELKPHTDMSFLMMIIGAVTILFAVMMALVQKNYKRLLSYHAISQVGYMILGIGTAVPVGIIGGLFHMLNNAMYKSALFLTAGSVERQAGTADLKKLGGLRQKMPITFACFMVTAAAISGFPFLNGFYSKEMIFDGALEAGPIFYLAAVIGAFFTAASFLKLGHAAYFDKPRESVGEVKEAPLSMLLPMIVIALGCIVFGIFNVIPLNTLIGPGISQHLEGHHFGGVLPENWLLTGISVFVLFLAYLNHRYGSRKTGMGLGAVDHIHHAPVLNNVYDMAERRLFDPYDIGLKITNIIARIAWLIDRGIDWIYNSLFVWLAYTFSKGIRKAHTGNHAMYVLWTVCGLILIIIYFAATFN
ncbi:MAG: NADH-quinone oxidoreductase subunit L [Candidatus Omnitrophota bacterium]